MVVLPLLKTLNYGFCAVAFTRVLKNVVTFALVGDPSTGLADGDVDILFNVDG
jgi:hypothetical protein